MAAVAVDTLWSGATTGLISIGVGEFLTAEEFMCFGAGFIRFRPVGPALDRTSIVSTRSMKVAKPGVC